MNHLDQQDSVLYIVGMNDFAFEVQTLLHDTTNHWQWFNFLGEKPKFLDDSNPKADGKTMDLPEGRKFVCAIRNTRRRKSMVKSIETGGPGDNCAMRLISPDVLYCLGHEQTVVGEGTVIFPQTYLSSKVRIGRHCQIGVGVVIHHDVTIGDFVNIGSRSVIGAGSTVGDGVNIEPGCVIMGSNVEIEQGAAVRAGSAVTARVGENVVLTATGFEGALATW